MKRFAKILFILAVLTVLAPVVLGLLGLTADLPVGLVAPCLIVMGTVLQIRSDPVYSRVSVN